MSLQANKTSSPIRAICKEKVAFRWLYRTLHYGGCIELYISLVVSNFTLRWLYRTLHYGGCIELYISLVVSNFTLRWLYRTLHYGGCIELYKVFKAFDILV